MALNPWKASQEVVDLVDGIIKKHHLPRLSEASVAVCFDDTKPFVKNKLNLGKVTKFSPLAKLWQNQRHDFCLSIPSDLWHSILQHQQREAYLDLQLTRCEVEYVAEEITDANGKKHKVKDEWGRVQYTDVIAQDEEGNPKWKVVPAGLEVITKNFRRYGLWMESLEETLEELAAICVRAKGENGPQTN